ncbi:uncharacterized protein SPPG_05512 [Spizellomyces punctatus DAOM BR117]|uniref:Signal recognition particle subunit SRP72 n=1 Tax=Spizellomyces punctatus (strain DAOM BR117) TaxID=645134 RepID=A0A0L0HDQ4_SPIPD|nr:uncharacterized protein SPPG_05512 [Spizellomyces punctatus DAOM BR117]KNC99257.1 hypothetical protein SPPG_05512 [Spizellomyces punctatus DAOM BR117]|eukprot:XP_016607297.1 hypothetical protein SPPG_05512 [Spizellomyces punctatus DAOM BR117]
MAETTQGLFVELNSMCLGSNYDKIVETCDKILRSEPSDPDAIHTKIVALIRLEQYTNALKLIDSPTIPTFLREELVFERAYCLYRANRLQDCLDLVRKQREDAAKNFGSDVERSLRHLEAQVLYRFEKYDNCDQIYKELSTSAEEYEQGELRANILAVKAAAVANGEKLVDEMEIDVSSDSYEVAYNVACMHLAKRELDQAASLLEKAKGLCRESLAAEQYSEEEIQQELAVIAVQLAYVHQLQGRSAEAIELYETVLKLKGTDTAISAIASNNLMTVKKNRDLPDAAKLYRLATSSGLEHKLTSVQRRIIAVNGALLSLSMSKFGDARQKAKALCDQYPGDDTPYLILAGISLQEKKLPSKALEELQQYVQKLPHSLSIHLALAQLLIEQSNLRGALNLMKTFADSASEDKRYQPAVVSLLVWLYGQVNEVDTAVSLLEEATRFWKGSNNERPILKQLASYKLKCQRPQDAAQDYERLVKADPTDVESVAGLIIAYSEFDPSLAEQYQQYLPSDAQVPKSFIDVDAIESAFGSTGNNKRMRETGAEGSSKPKKRKRKPKLPKNIDPNVAPDPERWLPKRDRSTYAKKGKGKRDIGKGPQGAALAGGGLGGTGSANIEGRKSVGAKKETPPDSPQLAPVTQKPAPPAQQATSNKKKKKGKK